MDNLTRNEHHWFLVNHLNEFKQFVLDNIELSEDFDDHNKFVSFCLGLFEEEMEDRSNLSLNEKPFTKVGG